jgi:hypothetical protein
VPDLDLPRSCAEAESASYTAGAGMSLPGVRVVEK